MIRFILPSVLLATTLAIAPSAQAAGSLTRTFVSSAGSESNPCTISQPCATFATAYAATAANGTVTALDPGKYGPLTILGAVTIDGNGWASITAPAGGNGITINAGSNDQVTLIGLAIDGVGTANNGVLYNSGSTLKVLNCSIKNTLSNGIYVGALNSMSLFVSHTFMSNISNSSQSSSGVYFYNGGVNAIVATLDHVTVIDSHVGVSLYATGGNVEAMITDSEIATSVVGFVAQGQSSTATVNVILSNAKISDVVLAVQPMGYTTAYLSQIVQTSYPGNSGIATLGTNNSLYSDNTNHLAGVCCTLNPWSPQ
jgi:hypothetical protein